MKVFDLESNKVLDIVMKPHRKILDLKCGHNNIYVADHTNKSVIVSGVEEKLINYDNDVEISKTVTDTDSNPFKQAFYQKNQSIDPSESYGGGGTVTSQSTAQFGRKHSRQRQSSGLKGSVLASSGLNMIKQYSYADNTARDPYTGARYDFTDFDDLSKSPSKVIPSMASVDNTPSSPPTISSYELNEIINKVNNNHMKVMQLFKHRKSQLWSLQQYWTTGNTVKALKFLLQ